MKYKYRLHLTNNTILEIKGKAITDWPENFVRFEDQSTNDAVIVNTDQITHIEEIIEK